MCKLFPVFHPKNRWAMLASLILVSVGACEKRPDPVDSVAPPKEKPAASHIAPKRTAPPPPPSIPTPAAAADSFASSVRQLLDGAGVQTAVLPFAEERSGGTTPCSTALADLIVDAFVRAGLGVVDRETLARSWEEIDLAAAFDNTAPAANITAADLLVVGRYSLVAGQLELRAKVVEVRTNRLLLTRSLVMQPDARLKSLATGGGQSATVGEGVVAEQSGSVVRITASYVEAGASQLRLLDRVRQKHRRALRDYLLNAMGCKMPADEVEHLFRRGRETDCQFDPGEVTLVMEFGVQACMSDDGAG